MVEIRSSWWEYNANALKMLRPSPRRKDEELGTVMACGTGEVFSG